VTATTGGGPPLLTDETWARLDPDAGRLSGADRRRVLVVAVVAAVLVVGAGVVWRGGLLWPRIETQLAGYDTDSQGRTFRMVLQVDNRGLTDVHVRSVGRSGSGLRLLGASEVPTGVPSSTGLEVTLRYRVTDCAAVQRGDWPVPVVVDRPWGSLTTYDEAPTMPAANAPATYSYRGDDPYAVPWQVYLARRACR
jgi:hypothetical protein